MKKVFLDDLLRYKEGKYKGKINWKKCIGYKVKFIYDDIEGEVEINNYNSNKQQLEIKYNDIYFKLHTSSFSNCKLGELLGRNTKKYKYNIGDIIETKTGRIEILEQTRKKNGSETQKAYKYKCLIDGYEGIISEYGINEKQGCSACGNKIVRKGIDDIASLYPNLLKYFVNINDAYNHSKGSDVFLEFKCPDCGYIKNIQVKTFVKYQGFNCPKCGDGLSYPEKFMFNILEQLNLDFIYQYNPKWIKPKKYDFYILIFNMIIETHGEQHYTNNFSQSNKTVKDIQDNDTFKLNTALKNGINKYIVIDCLKSDLDYIKNNILSSKLNELFDLSNIDWYKCHEFACNSRVKEMSDLWNSGIHSTIDISKIANMHNSTVRKYLKLGRNLGWNNYDESIAKKSGGIKQKIKVICLNTLEIFDSSKEVEDKHNVHKTDVWRLCHDNGNFISVNNEPYVFMYYDNYLKLSNQEIEDKLNKAKEMYFKSGISKQVVCLNTLEIFNSLHEAAKKYNILYVGISSCCRKINNFAGKLEDGTKLIWMYYKEYLTKSKDEIDKIVYDIQDKKIICLTTNKIFNNIKMAGKYYNIKNFDKNIYNNLNNKVNYCGKLEDGTKLNWMFYDDYLGNGIRKFVYKNSKKVQCIETGQVFDSVTKLSKESINIFGINLTQTGIQRVCRNERKHYKGYHFKYIS